MNWEAIGAIGEVGGALAVVFTLLFLAYQIRQNTKASRSLSVQQWNMTVSPQNEAVFGDREFAEIILRASTDYDSLDRVEKRMYRSYLIQAFNNFELLYLQRQQSTIDDKFFRSKIEIYLKNLEIPVVFSFWQSIGPDFLDARFRAFVDEELESRKPQDDA